MKLLKNVTYTVFSNMLSILVSTIIVLVIPKFIGVKEYGFWQIFIFYANYVGMLHLGWADGLFLRRGGQHVKNINVKSLNAETILFIGFNFFVGICIIGSSLFVKNEYKFIVISIGITVVVANLRTWITMILQSTGNFKSYAINLSAQSLVYLILIIGILFFKLLDFKYMIVAFIISQLATSISGFVQLYSLFKSNEHKVSFDFLSAMRETAQNINAGFKLMIANSTALLIVGVIRFGIQQQWSVTTFGKVSLILSIANLITVFINAVSLVLFPTLRRTKQLTKSVYLGIRSVLMPFLYIVMIVYFPIRVIIPIWLPRYSDVLQFASVLIPMMVYQGKFEILSNTFMKSLRMEATLMIINIITLLISVVLTFATVYMFHQINLAIFSIAFVMGFRSILSEVILSKKIQVAYFGDVLFENCIVLGFMILSWNYSVIVAFIAYLIVVVLYLFVKRNEIKSGLDVLKELSKY